MPICEAFGDFCQNYTYAFKNSPLNTSTSNNYNKSAYTDHGLEVELDCGCINEAFYLGYQIQCAYYDFFYSSVDVFSFLF